MKRELHPVWKLPTKVQGEWKNPDGTLTPEAWRLLRAYNDLGYIPQVENGEVVSVRFKTPKPEWEGELP